MLAARAVRFETGISSTSPRVAQPGTFHPPVYAPFNECSGRELSRPVDNRTGPKRKILAAGEGFRIFPFVVGHESDRRNWRRLLIRSPASRTAKTLRSNQVRAGRKPAASDRWRDGIRRLVRRVPELPRPPETKGREKRPRRQSGLLSPHVARPHREGKSLRPADAPDPRPRSRRVTAGEVGQILGTGPGTGRARAPTRNRRLVRGACPRKPRRGRGRETPRPSSRVPAMPPRWASDRGGHGRDHTVGRTPRSHEQGPGRVDRGGPRPGSWLPKNRSDTREGRGARKRTAPGRPTR